MYNSLGCRFRVTLPRLSTVPKTLLIIELNYRPPPPSPSTFSPGVASKLSFFSVGTKHSGPRPSLHDPFLCMMTHTPWWRQTQHRYYHKQAQSAPHTVSGEGERQPTKAGMLCRCSNRQPRESTFLHKVLSDSGAPYNSRRTRICVTAFPSADSRGIS